MRIVKRSNNILEFQLGSKPSTTKDVFSLCSDENFQDDSWITQGRKWQATPKTKINSKTKESLLDNS